MQYITKINLIVGIKDLLFYYQNIENNISS